MKRSALACALVLCSVTAGAVAQPASQRLAFVGCPILRNTQPVPCWLGQFKGEFYYLGPQGDLGAAFYPPQFNHRMLVEAVTTPERKCGGIVLTQVHASVLPDIDASCDITLPAEGYAESDKLRGPGPSGVRGAAPEPAGGGRRGESTGGAEALKIPYQPQAFTATFDADTDRAWRSAQAVIGRAARYIGETKARTVDVVGYRATVRLSDGKDFVERSGIAEDRAKTVATLLRNSDLPAGTKLNVTWVDKPLPTLGVGKDADQRKVVISVKP